MKKAKRNVTIVISSSDDDEDFSVKSNFTHTKPKLKPKLESASVPRKNPKRAKTAILSASCPRPSKKASVFDEMKRFCGEFDDDFRGIKVSAGLQSNNDMWIDRHKPYFLEELAVQKKKVNEVKTWFEERLNAAMMQDGHSNVLLVAGPSGVGKTACYCFTSWCHNMGVDHTYSNSLARTFA